MQNQEDPSKIIELNEEKSLADNTIIIFMSDNGGTLTGNNKPLKGYKGNLFEGGIRVPCVAKWQGKISPGTVSQQACMTFDFSASIVRAAGASIPENRTFDGMDILKHIKENQPVVDRILFWRARRGTNTRKALRHGNLKYIWLNNDGKVNEYLFDLGNDLSEERNLLDSLPDKVNQLKNMLEAWEEEVKPMR